MKILVILFYCAVVANSLPSNAVQPKIGVIYKGPDSSIVIEGPDGSIIKASANGGSVASGDVTVETPTTLEEKATTESTEDNSTPEPVSSTNVEIINEPLTTSAAPPLTPPATDDVELEGPSGKISVSGSKVVVAGPDSLLVKDSKNQVAIVEPAKDTEQSKTSDNEWQQQKIVHLVPGIYGGWIAHPGWDNLIVPGFPIVFNQPRFVRAA